MRNTAICYNTVLLLFCHLGALGMQVSIAGPNVAGILLTHAGGAPTRNYAQ
jgi:hypothetical protein